MASNNSIENIYSEFLAGLDKSMNRDAFFGYFLRCLQSGKNQMGITQKTVERKLEGKWLDVIEATVIPLDNIIRNPRRYIKNLEDVVPIEMARGITDESIVHLAQHTDMIAKIDDDGMVTPERILNITKEESFDTYENRFIYTLLNNLDFFIMRTLNSINDGGKDITEVSLSGESMIGREKIKYYMYMSCEGHGHSAASEHYELLNTDVSKLSVVQRVERIRKILFNFRETWLIKELKNCAPVRPPLHMTNVLLRNPDFVQAVELWNFISNYRGDDVEVSSVTNKLEPDEAFIKQMFSLVPLQYTVIKNNLGGEIEVVPKSVPDPSKTKIKVSPIKEQVEVIVESADIDVREIKKIFLDVLDKKEKEQKNEKTRVDSIIAHVLESERPWLEEEKIRLREKQKEMKLLEKMKPETIEELMISEEKTAEETVEAIVEEIVESPVEEVLEEAVEEIDETPAEEILEVVCGEPIDEEEEAIPEPEPQLNENSPSAWRRMLSQIRIKGKKQ